MSDDDMTTQGMTTQDDTSTVDVLAGWDPAGPPPVLDGSAPFPIDTVFAVGATFAGMVLGLALGGRHPLIRAKAGGILGLAGAIVVRRMWRLPG
jgi:hypothetical protein